MLPNREPKSSEALFTWKRRSTEPLTQILKQGRLRQLKLLDLTCQIRFLLFVLADHEDFSL